MRAVDTMLVSVDRSMLNIPQAETGPVRSNSLASGPGGSSLY